MFDKLVPNTQRRLDNITLESNRYAATPERSPVNVALTGETTARHTNSLHHIKEFRGEHAPSPSQLERSGMKLCVEASNILWY